MTAVMISVLDFDLLGQLLGSAIPTLKVGMVGLLVLWLACFWFGEIIEAAKRRCRQAVFRKDDIWPVGRGSR